MKQFPNYKIRDFKADFDWHVYHVFNDEEFKKDLSDNLRPISDQPSDKIYTSKYGQIEKNVIDEISIKYRLPSFYIREFLSGLDDSIITNGLDMEPVEVSFEPVYGEEPDMVVIRLFPWATQSDVTDKWKEVESLKKAAGYSLRKRGVENHTLIYAIFKSKSRDMAFSKIFKLYSERMLPGYDGYPVYDSEEVLESYYNKHKPKPRNV